MPVFADPAQLRAVADRIARHADATRAHAGTIGAHLAHPGWAGVAARAFHAQARALMHDLRRAAQRLDDAADALRRHAANVEHALAGLAELFTDGVDLGLDLAHTVGDLVTNPGNLLRDGRELLHDIAGLGPQVDGSQMLGLDR